MKFPFSMSLAFALMAATAPGLAMGEQAPDAIAISEDTSRPIDERLQILQKEIAANAAAMEKVRASMAHVRDQVREQQRTSLDLQKPVIEQDEKLLALQKEIEAKELELVRMRQLFHDQLAKNPLVKERREAQQAMARDFTASEAKLQELVNRSSALNSALKGLEAQKKEAEAKPSHETSGSK